MAISFRALLSSAVISLGVLLAPLPALALDAKDKLEVEQIIRDYLLANPELMLEVQQALEAKQKADAATKAARALKDNAEAIFASKNQGTIGNANGDITVVEFFDYNCGFCQRAMNDMITILKDDDQVKFVMKELPILSQGSVDAARISTAIYRLQPDRYGEFHTRLLGQNGPKDGSRALEIVKEMGLDTAAIEKEAAKEDVLDAFREANDLATNLGINGTPSYVIGDEVIFGALGAEVLKSKIANVRKCGSTQCG